MLCLLSLAVGAVAGAGAWIFRLLIGLVHNVFFLGELNWVYEATVHTPAGPWGAAIILAPVIGSLGVTWLVTRFAPEAKGHGVPEVIDAIHYGAGRIRPAVAAVKSVVSALSIGSGGSVGREGPIIQIGSAFGSTLGQMLQLPRGQRITLIAAGAGGGIAATFNAPLGGVLFAIELLLVSVNIRNVLPVVLATVVASFIGRALLGTLPAFHVPLLEMNRFRLDNPWGLLLFIPLGLVLGLAAVVFVRSIYLCEDWFDRLPVSPYLCHALGMLGVGITLYAVLLSTGHYYVQGVGYATIMDIMRGILTSPWLLLALSALKLVMTSLTLGSGGSGGVFSPSLFVGATLGAACGHLLQHAMPGVSIDVITFALAGMTAMVGASTGAVVTAIVMAQEMTLDSNVILPVLVTTAVAAALRKVVQPDSVYTLKLVRRGRVVPDSLQAAFDDARRVRDVMTRDFAVREPDAAGGSAATAGRVTLFARNGQIQGAWSGGARPDNVGPSAPGMSAAPTPAFDGNYVVVAPETPLVDALQKMRRADAAYALVASVGESSVSCRPLPASRIVGVLTLHDLGRYRVGIADLL